MAVIQFLLGLLPAAVAYFKINPRRAAHLVVVAIGYLTIALQVIEQIVVPVIRQAIMFLQQFVDALNIL